MELAEKALKHYFDFKGRAGIREFILAHIMIALVNVCLLAVLLGIIFVINLIVTQIGGLRASYAFLDSAQIFMSIIMVFSIGLGIAAIDSRRLHDLNLSSWWLVGAVALLVALNIYGFFTFATYLHLFFIIVLLFPADKRANRYGPARVSVLREEDEDF